MLLTRKDYNTPCPLKGEKEDISDGDISKYSLSHETGIPYVTLPAGTNTHL